MPALSDTLVLRNGTTVSGVLTGANNNTVTFRNRNGQSQRYAVRDVEIVQFGDAPYYQSGGPGYGNNGGNRNYDRAYMEQVVVPAGSEVRVRTHERIDSRQAAPGQAFSAQIEDDVRGPGNTIAIPRGSAATLITRQVDNNGDITLDLQSITVEGRRYRVSTEDRELDSRDGPGINRRTGEFAGGGAVLGAIIGAIAGGGKGAAIGAGAGAGAGIAAQVITRGKEVQVPAESVLRFRLDRPLRLRFWTS